MSRSTTPSFVVEFEVKSTSQDRRVVRSRMDVGRQLYNAVLGEALWRLGRVRHDPAFDRAKAMPRGERGKDATSLQKVQAKVRAEAFNSINERHGFREYDLHAHPSLASECWIRAHLGVHISQKVASRAFKAAERWSFGGSGKPRFKGPGELVSLEGKSNETGIRYRDGRIHWGGEFANLNLPLVEKPGDQVQAYALKLADDGDVKYVRMLLRTIRGEERLFAQLVMEGEPWVKLNEEFKPKHPVAKDQAGALDLGPSEAVLVTAEGKVKHFEFCPDLDRKEAAKRVYQRRIDRQRRVRNPKNYNPNGTIRKGKKTWDKSNRQVKVEYRLAEEQRRMAATRKSQQGALVHRVLAIAGNLISEKTNKREWAKDYGRSVGHKAPGMFEARLGLLAKAGGGGLEQVCTYATYLSSRCLCHKRKHKPRDERKHICGCSWFPEGTWADRDEFSAFLALYASGSRLDVDRAQKNWAEWGADCLLLPASDPSAAPRKPQEEGCVPLSPKRNRGRSGSVENEARPLRKSGHQRGRRAHGDSSPLKPSRIPPKPGGPNAV